VTDLDTLRVVDRSRELFPMSVPIIMILSNDAGVPASAAQADAVNTATLHEVIEWSKS
jgi:hypothetical protein